MAETWFYSPIFPLDLCKPYLEELCSRPKLCFELNGVYNQLFYDKLLDYVLNMGEEKIITLKIGVNSAFLEICELIMQARLFFT
uniref:Uncharacterized protein n=1 Tax=Ditylenchus dipsaci TaxID=166011 RepID=A0A915EL80_9BILA